MADSASAISGLPPDATPVAGGLPDDAVLHPQVTSTFTPLYAEPRPPGAPVLQVAPAPQPQQPAPAGGPDLGRFGQYAEFGRQLESGYYSGLAGVDHLIGNLSKMVEAGSDIPYLTGIPKSEIYKHIENWAQGQQQYREQQAAELTGGREDLPAKIVRGAAGAVTSLPVTMAAAALGGPMLGFGALGALENLDQGTKTTLMGATEGALAGKFYQLIGPAGRLIKVPLVGLANYFQLRAHGVDPETAFSNAVTPALMSGMEPGTLSAREMPASIRENLTPNFLAVSPAKSAAAQQVIEQGQKYGVRLTAGDVSQIPSLKNMEVSTEQLPFSGMQKLRAAQQEEAKAAAAGIKSKYGEALINTDPSSVAELQDAAQGGDQRARNVLEKMNNAGNDPDRIIQASIGLGDWTTRQTATGLYDRVQQLAEEHNLGDVPLDATGKAIGSSLQQLRPAKLPNKEVIGLLQKIKESISPKLDAEGKPVVDEQGNPVTPDNSYGLIRQLHSDLGERIREYYQGNNALIGEKGVGYLERVQNALEDDMRNYAQNSKVPEIVDAGQAADEYYKTARVPYKNGMLAAAATSNEPDQIFQQFIKAGKGDRAQNFYDALDDRGQAAVRYNMVAKAVDDSINPQSGIFSPQKFLTAVDKLDDAYGVFFTAKDKAEIQGFKNLMGHVTRAGQYMENPPTGKQAIPFLVAGGAISAIPAAMAHPMVAGGGVAMLGMARALFTTTTGRNLLLRAYRIKPGTPLMNSVWQQVGQEMPKLSGPPAGGGPPPPPPPGGGGGVAPAAGPRAASMGKGPDQALAYAREQAAAGNDVKAQDLQRRFQLGYGAAQKVVENARAKRGGPPPPPPPAAGGVGAQL